MTVAIRLFFALFLFVLTCTSQTKNDDAYFILNTDDKDYVIRAKGKEINEVAKPHSIGIFHLYNRSQYLEREKQIEHDKKEGSFEGYQFYKRPDELVFNVVGNSKINTRCETNSLNIVDYKWVEMNTWKEGNSNILFKDLYFLLKIEKDKYLKFKVKRTIIAR